MNRIRSHLLRPLHPKHRTFLTACAPRRASHHPPLPESMQREAMKHQYAPEFAHHQQLARTQTPWVPRRLRKRVAEQRRRQQLRKQRHVEFLRVQSKVRPFLQQTATTSEDVAAAQKEAPAPPAPPAAHPDPMVDYQQRMDWMRQKYQYEIEVEQQQERQRAAQRVEEERRAEQERAQLRQQHERQQQREHALHTQTEQLLAAMDDHFLRQIRREKVQRLEQDKARQRQENLVRLYRDAKHFVTPESLEQKLEEFFETELHAQNLPLAKMRLLAVEERRAEREDKLFDALHDSFEAGLTLAEQKQQVETWKRVGENVLSAQKQVSPDS